jgi:WD40 repeat protein
MILPTANLKGLRIVSLESGKDEGDLFEQLHKKKINLVKYDQNGNIITASDDLSICIIDRRMNKKFIETESPVISIAYSNDGKYIFTGADDMRVTVWFHKWTKLCELSSPVYVDKLYISKSNEFLFAIPYKVGEEKNAGKIQIWRIAHEFNDTNMKHQFAIKGTMNCLFP